MANVVTYVINVITDDVARTASAIRNAAVEDGVSLLESRWAPDHDTIADAYDSEEDPHVTMMIDR